MKKLLSLSCYTFLLIGFMHIMIGSLLPSILSYYGKTYTDGGTLIAIQSLGLFVGVGLSSLCANKIGRRWTIVFSCGLVAISQAVFALLLPWAWWLLFVFIAGIGFGVIEPLIGALIIDTIKKNTAVAFSKLEVYFGLGSLITPIVSGWLATTGNWRFSFLLLAVYALSISVVWMKLSFGELNEALKRSQLAISESKGKKTTHKSLYFGFIFFFAVYVGVEVSFMNFLPSMLVHQLNTGTFQATFSVTLFWGAMVVGRLIAGHIAEKISYARFLLGSSIFTVVFLFWTGTVHQLWGIYVLVFLVGLMMSGIFGIAMVYANRILPGPTSRNTSVFIAAGAVGSVILPIVTGLIMDYLSTFLVAVALAVLSCYMVIFIYRIQKVSIERRSGY
ncbi:MFS transporter [Bacillus solitudinis]|uniref:MFS transporter n=1 Tax=Bacillus solitudinis TaxID=2014074 RepID=UPI000C243F3B|nr:MFS transporter [Bacillus solitudinis]